MACTQVIKCKCVVESIALSPDGQLLAVGVVGNGFQLLDVRSGLVFSLAFSPASSSPLLLAASLDGDTVRVWDCSSGARVAELKGHGSMPWVAFSPDGRLLASGSWDAAVRLWRTDDWHAPPAVLRGHASDVNCVAFSCDSRLLASGSKDDTVRLWRILNRGTAAAAPAAAAGPVLEVGQWINGVMFSPVDSTLLAYCDWEGFICLARVGAGDGDGDGAITLTVERELRGSRATAFGLAFSPCGRRLASTSSDDPVRLWSVASGACLRVLKGHSRSVFAVTFFPDGKQLVTGSGDKTIRIWALSWSDQTHRHFSAPLKAAVFTLMCVRARLERTQSRRRARLPRLPMEVWLMVFAQLQLALDANAVRRSRRGLK